MNAEILQSQPVFPGSLASNVLRLIDLLFDDDLNVHLQSVSTLAKRVLLNGLIEDPALFMRYFFEKITQKDRKVTYQNLKCLAFLQMNILFLTGSYNQIFAYTNKFLHRYTTTNGLCYFQLSCT
jgi:hypothetical protein